MTLCIVWRRGDQVHFSSDSRICIYHSIADVGIKVLRVPYKIYGPSTTYDPVKNAFRVPILVGGAIGMCIAGSALNALLIKESIVEIMQDLQAIPDYTDFSMEGLSEFIFSAYKIISRKLCETDVGKEGRAVIIIGGYCSLKKKNRVFKFVTDLNNHASKTEILNKDGEYEFIGSVEKIAELHASNPPQTDIDYIRLLKSVIDDPTELKVGGAIQYGRLENGDFSILGMLDYDGDEENKNGISYMRGGIDLRAPEFDRLLPLINYLDIKPPRNN